MCDLLPSCSPQALGKAPAAEGGFRFCWGFEPSFMPVLWEGVCGQHNPSSVGRGAEPSLGGNLLLPSSQTTDSCAFLGWKRCIIQCCLSHGPPCPALSWACLYFVCVVPNPRFPLVPSLTSPTFLCWSMIASRLLPVCHVYSWIC